VDILAKAVPLLPNDLIIMIGATKDSDLARIRSIVGEAKNAIVEGFKPQEMLPWYLASADVLVLPNTANDENSRLYTSPMKLFEYMAADRPIVASDLPSLRQILSEENSVLVPPDDPQALANGIKQLLNNPDQAKIFVARTKVEILNYTWDKRARSIIDFVKSDV
jgi:glycosyltransferase involved in cell wall biosynthesis